MRPSDIPGDYTEKTQSTHIKHSIGPQVDDEPFHIMAVRSPVTRNLISRFDDIRDEIVESFKEYIPLTEGKLG